MAFRLVMLPPTNERMRQWAARIGAAVNDVDVIVCPDRGAASSQLRDGADAAYGSLDAQLLADAPRLRWLISPAAGPNPGY